MAVSDWVVTYDVRDDRARLRVSRLLEPYGPRVLHSVFELRASPWTAARLHARVTGLLAPDDRLLLLPGCERCRRSVHGGSLEPEPARATVIG